MEVGEREAGICDQHFYHGECGCPCHRAPLPVVALLRGAPREATAKGVGGSSPIVDTTAYGVRRTPSSRARPVGSSFTTQASPEHVRHYPVPITMPTSGSFFFTASSSAVRARLGTSVPGRRLDEPGRCEVRAEHGGHRSGVPR